MFTVYRAYGPKSNLSYYGYSQSDDVKTAFLDGAHRPDMDRADVRLYMANGEDDEVIKIEVIDAFDDEISAWMCRNDNRAVHPDSISGPTMFPCSIAERAMKDAPERIKQWKKAVDQWAAPTARAAWALGLWTAAQIKELTFSYPKKQIITDLDALNPQEFTFKYEMNRGA